MRLLRWVATAMCLVATLSTTGFAQGEQGRFAGTVRDSSGAFVPGVTVTAKNERTGEVRTAVTNAQGYFVIAPLKPSNYTLSADLSGFAKIEYTAMPIAAGQELSLDFEMKPAGVSEAVTVVGTSPVLDLSSAKIGVNVGEREVNSLPVNGRQMSQLMLQAPGSTNSGTGTWNDVRFSGRAVEQNAIKYDGVEGSGIIDAMPGVANGENNTPFKLQASLENVQEFRVESSAYPAEFGTGTGGQVNVITKSGSNDFHGAVFEYARRDAWDSKSYFDDLRNPDGGIQSQGPKSPLALNNFGGSIGGPIARNRAFFFGSYEGYRLDAGQNFIEAVPSAAAWARAVPTIAALRPQWLAPGAVIIPGASTNPDFDIAQNQASEKVHEDAYSGRVDFKLNDRWTAYGRVFHDQGSDNAPQGVTGRYFVTTINPTNGVFNLTGILSDKTTNEFKFGYNGATSNEYGTTQPLFQGIAINYTGTVANSGLAGQTGTTGAASPGGLVRVNSAGNGRGAPYEPYSLTFADTVSRVSGNHFIKMGADIRAIRMTMDQLGGITYTYQNLTTFLANTPSSIQYFGDVSEPSPFNNGASGPKHSKQEYYVGYVQDEWRASPKFTLNYGLRYDYYTPLSEVDDRIVKFDINTGQIDPNTTPFYKSSKTNFQPRVGATYALTDKTVLRGGAGIFVGPGQTEDQIQPIEAERISTTLTSGPLLAYPIDPNLIRANFLNNPNNRSYQPRAYSNDYTIPEKVYQYTASVQQELAGSMALTAAYIGSQGRNLFLRSISNQTVGVLQTTPTAAAANIRQFDIVTCSNGAVLNGTQTPITSQVCGPGISAVSKQSPFAEVDFKTSGGYDSYNAMQLGISRRAAAGLAMNAQYTLGISKGTSGGSNEARTVGNNALAIPDFDYDYGYNNFDVRHSFNLSLLFTTSGTNAFTRGWTVGGIVNARSGVPINVLITRPDIVYVDGAGNVWNAPAADRTAIINTPGGGASRSSRRPDLVAGVDPFQTSGGLIFLNPAAFTTPKPGTEGNLERNSLHGPNFYQTDFVVSKRVELGGRGPSFDLRMEVFNLFNRVNIDAVGGINSTLPNALPSTAGQANTVQPGQPFTAAAAGAFGRETATVGRTVGLGTARQVQLAVRFNF
jgi:Carboxypeptidase regulatory-like domain/TonB dependent receptor